MARAATRNLACLQCAARSCGWFAALLKRRLLPVMAALDTAGADMAVHELTFPVTDEAEILKLRAGDEVVVQGHIIGIRDRTQIRIFDEGVEPPMDLKG